jgi:hypothetical protein
MVESYENFLDNRMGRMMQEYIERRMPLVSDMKRRCLIREGKGQDSADCSGVCQLQDFHPKSHQGLSHATLCTG